MTDNEKLVAGLRELADFYEANPEMPNFFVGGHLHAYEAASFRSTVKSLAHGGMVVKETDPDTSTFPEHRGIRYFGPVKMTVSVYKSKVCKKVRKFMEVDTWECPDSLLEEPEQVSA